MSAGSPYKGMGRGYRGSLERRFFALVDKTETCWVWKGSMHNGYGEFRRFHREPMSRAHRVAYELIVGPIPDGLELDHLCRNRSCVNPAHLEPVDHRTNVLRGEGLTARYARRNACSEGHPFTPENTYMRPSGGRRCKTCRLDAQRRRNTQRAVAS